MGLFSRTDGPPAAESPATPPAPSQVRRPQDVSEVRSAQEALTSRQEQLQRLKSKRDEARNEVRRIEEKTLELEAAGEDPAVLLAAAHRQVETIEKMVVMSENAVERATAARDDALESARAALRKERLGPIIEMLDRQEALLWEALAVSRAIDAAIAAAAADEITLVGHAQYWGIGSPTYPLLRTDNQILTWRRNRTIAPR